jgi:hypothetical protein
MKVECVGPPLIYRWPKGEVRLVPGHPVELPEDRATRLLEKAPGRVRVVNSADRIDVNLIGRIVSWDSPLFGLVSATVLEDLRHGVRVFHPLTELECVIPMKWLSRQYQ